MLKLGVAAGVAALTGGFMVRNVYQWETTRHSLAVPGLRQPLRVVQLSDLHYGLYLRQDSVSAWVDAALAARPDLIVLTGDLADGHSRVPLQPLLDALAPLQAPLGVWSVWGNHDYFNGGTHRELDAGLKQLGINTLLNEHQLIRPDLTLAGVDDFRMGRPDLAAALQGITPDAATILLTHNPDQLPELEQLPQALNQVGLALAGHTHGGQVRLPILGALITSSEYGQRFAQGWVNDPVRAYISRGLGVSALPIRLLCPPELAIFDLQPA